MEYFKFIDPDIDSSKNKKYTIWNRIVYKFLSIFIPQSNPSFYDKYYLVVLWYIEYDDINNYANREIGLDINGKVIVKAPYNGNHGLWTDSNLVLKDYQKWNIEEISSEIFENLWSRI